MVVALRGTCISVWLFGCLLLGAGVAEAQEQNALAIQEALIWTGYYRGPLDGEIGPGTVVAIKRFQAKLKRLNTGTIGQVEWATLFVPFEGEYGCDKEKCDWKGAALENAPVWSKTPYFRKGDRLLLSGKQNADLEGSLQPATREVFQEGAKDKTVQYLLKFRRE